MKPETKTCQQCGKEFSRKAKNANRDWTQKRFCGRSCATRNMGKKNAGSTAWNKGKPAPWAIGEKNVNWNGGKVCIDCGKKLNNGKKINKTKDRCRKCSSKFYSGENSWNFKHGKSKSRHSYDYLLWRNAVYKRDHYHCAMCSKHCAKDIEAHHIMRYVDAPDWKYDLCNGITLCSECHLKTRGKEDYYSPIFLNVLATRESNRFVWSHN